MFQELGLDRVLAAHQEKTRPILARRQDGAGHGMRGGKIASHRVDGDRHFHVSTLPGRAHPDGPRWLDRPAAVTRPVRSGPPNPALDLSDLDDFPSLVVPAMRAGP